MASGEIKCKWCKRPLEFVPIGWRATSGYHSEMANTMHCDVNPEGIHELAEPATQREEASNPKEQTNAGIIHDNLRTQYDNAVLIQMTTLTYEGWLEALLDTANSEIRSLDQDRKRLGSALHEEASRDSQDDVIFCQVCTHPIADHVINDMGPEWFCDINGCKCTSAPGPSLPTEAPRVEETATQWLVKRLSRKELEEFAWKAAQRAAELERRLPKPPKAARASIQENPK